MALESQRRNAREFKQLLFGVEIPKPKRVVPVIGGQNFSVGRELHCPEDLVALRESLERLGVTEPPEIAPLKTTQVSFAGFRLVGLQQRGGLRGIALQSVLQSHIHVGHIATKAGFFLLSSGLGAKSIETNRRQG